MQLDFNKLESAKGQAVVNVTSEELKSAMKKAFAERKNRFQVPGFRRGKAPMGVVLRMYGEAVLYDDALQHLMEDLISKDLQAIEDFATVTDSNVESINMEEGANIKFDICLYPDVKLGKYKGRKVDKLVPKVSDKEIAERADKELEKVRSDAGRMVTLDDEHLIEKGDIAVIDYEGSIDGELFAGGSAKNHSLEIGSGSFIPGFEDQLVGHKSGEEVLVNVKFPDDYHGEDVKGKDAQFKVNINEVKKLELPELDDDFAADVSEFDKLDDYKESLRKSACEAMEKEYSSKFESDLMLQIMADSEFVAPEPMVDMELRKLYGRYKDYAERMGVPVDQFFQYFMGGAERAFAQLRSSAEQNVLMECMLRAVVKEEKIEVNEDDYNKLCERLAAENNQTVDNVKKSLSFDDQLTKHMVAMTKAEDLIKESTKTVEVSADKVEEYDSDLAERMKKLSEEVQMSHIVKHEHTHDHEHDHCDCGCDHDHDHSHHDADCDCEECKEDSEK